MVLPILLRLLLELCVVRLDPDAAGILSGTFCTGNGESAREFDIFVTDSKAVKQRSKGDDQGSTREMSLDVVSFQNLVESSREASIASKAPFVRRGLEGRGIGSTR